MWMIIGRIIVIQLIRLCAGLVRDAQGNIVPNSRFPDMKEMVDYIHGLGLKAGLYSSPGPWTCGGCAGSWQHEQQDAAQYAAWGFDYLKYDLCTYHDVMPACETALADRRKSLIALMGEFLKQQPRDIVFSLCQYGECRRLEMGRALLAAIPGAQPATSVTVGAA